MKNLKSERPVKLGYAITRVSSTKQAEVQHGSLEQQRHMIERWVDSHFRNSECEYKLIKFIEEDISGRGSSLHKRRGLRELELAMERGEIDFFVAEKVDRIARDQIYTLKLVKRANELGVEVFEVESGLINFRDRGSRLGFNVKNFMAEEYSWDLEEKVTKKIREAMVNNGKDNATIPVLGLDSHPTRVGIYVRNEREITILNEIIEAFLQAQSYKPVLELCKKKGYKTKARYTREKIDRDGNRIPSRKIGGKDYDKNSLRVLLQDSKLRGYSTFVDTWNQFPDLQDEKGVVTWNYDHGAVIDRETVGKIDAVTSRFKHRNPRVSKYNSFLLTGIIEAEDGTKYYGEPAKSGANNYYYNKKHKRRYRTSEIDGIVVGRIKEYLNDQGLLIRVYEKSQKYGSSGLPAIQEERSRLKGEIARLESVVKKFSDSARDLALKTQSSDEFARVLESLLEEKSSAKKDLAELKEEYSQLEAKGSQLRGNIEGQTLQVFLKKIMRRFDQLPAAERKRAIRSFVYKIVLTGDRKVVLHINLDPGNPGPGNVLQGDLGGSGKTGKIGPRVAVAAYRGCG